MLVSGDRIKETSTSTGTGDLVLAGASTGFREVSAAKRLDGSAIADGDFFSYAVTMGADLETGIGRWNSGADSLTRLEVHSSSNGGNKVDWAAGTKDIILTAVAKQLPLLPPFPTITNLVARVETAFSPITVADGRVSQINDLSGNGNHFTAAGALRPRLVPHFWGRYGALYFDGATTRMERAITQAQPLTIIIVLADYTGGAANDNLYRDSLGGPVSFISGGNTWAIFAGSTLSSTALYTQNNTLVPTGRTRNMATRIDLYDGNNSLIANNGVETAAAAAGATGVGGTFRLGGDGGTSFAKMFFAGLFMFGKALSSGERGEMNAYTRDVYGIPIS